MPEFVTVATTDEIKPGERIVVEIDDVWVVIFNVDGTYYAIEDMCTHEEYYLSEGELTVMRSNARSTARSSMCARAKCSRRPRHVPVKWYEVRVVGDEVQVARR